MIKAVFDLQIDRVFWPASFWPAPADTATRWPAYVRDMLRSHLKQVWLYDSPTVSWRVVARSPVAQVLRPALLALPGSSDAQAADRLGSLVGDASQAAGLGDLAVDAFLERLGPALAR
jgi:hypothetical protein